MNYVIHRLFIWYSRLRKPVQRVCHSDEAVENLIKSYKLRVPNCRILIKKFTLVFEMVDGVCHFDAPLNQLAEDEVFSWVAHTAKAIVAAKEEFKATAKEVKEKIETAKKDGSIIGMALFVEEGYEL